MLVVLDSALNMETEQENIISGGTEIKMSYTALERCMEEKWGVWTIPIAEQGQQKGWHTAGCWGWLPLGHRASQQDML